MPRPSHLLTLTPLETWRIARQRLPLLRGGPSWTAKELMSSPKHNRGIRFAEFLLRQQLVVQQALPGWEPIDFADRRVVEVGCGPLAGYGPLALFLGARSFESAEPEWDPTLFFSMPVRDKYLRIFHADLCALYGERMTFDAFLERLNNDLGVSKCGFEAAPIDGDIDVVLSQSVLEHVFPVNATLAKLATLQTQATRFLHLVDFGNHYPTSNPFDGLYTNTLESYIAARGMAINGLRINEIETAVEQAGLAAVAVPSRVVEPQGSIHDSWRARSTSQSLSTQLALFCDPV